MQNPERLATKQDLSDMYTRILPYLNKSVDAGFTPVGSIIAIMGVTAPANYLACDGTVYNIADYPELANYFYQQFGSKNKFGGNGTTTFAVPDLRGEFLRGTGTNSHTNQGNGSAVGTHQNATQHLRIGGGATNDLFLYPNNTNWMNEAYADKYSTSASNKLRKATLADSGTQENATYYMSRPTNTSILWCIATKNIYLNPSLDYSTEEKVIGTWIDGKTLFQKTIYYGTQITIDNTYKETEIADLTSLNIDTVVAPIEGFIADYGVNHNWMPIPQITNISNLESMLECFYNASSKKLQFRAYRSTSTANINDIYVTLRYTKTT